MTGTVFFKSIMFLIVFSVKPFRIRRLLDLQAKMVSLFQIL